MTAPAQLKQAARAAFHRGGGLRLARWVNRKGLRVLMYHRFPDAAGLAAQCRHLRDWYHPVALGDAVQRLASGEPLPPHAVAVTVDDGYRDFFETAHPVFAAYGISATVYLVTGFLDGHLWLWVDQVQYAFRHTRHTQLRLDLPGCPPFEATLESEERRSAAARRLCEALKGLRNQDRLSVLAALPELLGVGIPARPPAADAPLTWEQVRLLARQGVEFGAHTATHPILSRVESAADLAQEIGGSKRRLEEMLGTPVRHFCYPNGRAVDISPEAVGAVREAGYHTAVTTVTGANFRGADRLDLHRVGADPRLDFGYFQRSVATAGL